MTAQGMKPTHLRKASTASDGFGDFVDSAHAEQVDEPSDGNGDTYIDDDEWQDADLVAGFSPLSPRHDGLHLWNGSSSAIPSTLPKVEAAPRSQPLPRTMLDEPDWAAWETPRGPTPGPSAGSDATNAAHDDAIKAAFERMTLEQQRQAQQRPSPPMIDLRPVERKLDLQRGGGNAVPLRQEDLDFFDSFDRNPRAVMAHSRGASHERQALGGDQLHSMREAQASPMNIATPAGAAASTRTGIDDYFGGGTQRIATTSSPIQSPSDDHLATSPSEKRQQGSWSDTAGGWAGSFRRTLGTIRGHLPSARDFIVSDDEETTKGEGSRNTRKDEAWSEREADHGLRRKHSRKLVSVAGHSQNTPFSSGSDATSPPARIAPHRRPSLRGNESTGVFGVHAPAGGHHSNAPVSGAPGFDPNAGRNWNTGSWTMSSRDEAERRRKPIPVKLTGRREETQEVVKSDLAAALTAHLPKRLQLGKSWRLLYSSDQHGISLGTLYHKVQEGLEQRNGGARRNIAMAAEGWLRGASEATRAAIAGGGGVQHVGGGIDLSEAGLLLAIKDDDEHLFGAFVNERIRAQSSYYGNGECFLWKQQADDGALRTFAWTGKNDYMVLTDTHFLSFGGGEGKYGLWLDGNLEHGVSTSCPAFDNDVLCDGRAAAAADGAGEAEGRFDCIALEVWACGVD